MKIKIIHGVNLNFTGIREKHIYGDATLTDINSLIAEKAGALGIDIEIFQSNSEGEIVDQIQKCYYDKVDGIVINPGAYAHYSYAIRDALASVPIPAIEVHMSNIHKREQFRHTSVITEVCKGQISGLGYDVYLLALEHLSNFVKKS